MKILVTGAHGTLGRAFGQSCASRHLPHTLVDRDQMDAADPASVAHALDHLRPDVCVHAVEPMNGEDGSDDRVACWRDGCVGTVRLAEACARRGVRLVTFSSDQVFDGRAFEPYMESSPTSPRGARGRALAAAESAVLEAHRTALVIRTAPLFGRAGDFLAGALERAARGEAVTADDGHVLSPTYIPDLVNTTLDLLLQGASGLWHVTNDGSSSLYALVRRACELRRLDAGVVKRGHARRFDLSTALTSGRGLRLPTLEEALARHLHFGQKMTA